ncbi:MAG: hypothetical protein KAY37_05945, partial [Phycisphaerae bacterium]|nr:hypothetical protein [Phycisphaerae bacterium]
MFEDRELNGLSRPTFDTIGLMKKEETWGGGVATVVEEASGEEGVVEEWRERDGALGLRSDGRHRDDDFDDDDDDDD